MFVKKEHFKNAMGDTISAIRKIDYSQLDISEYNLNYINRILLHIDFYFKIYENSLSYLISQEVPEGYIIDFGGGHGFLSLFLKKLGLNVIYCDLNPLSVKTVTLLKEKTGFGPDIIIEGSSPELLSFCKANNIIPPYLISTDLIEHVYNLDTFFADLYALNADISMVFTTGSNPLNFLKSKRLRKDMIKEDRTVYFTERKKFLQEKYPEISPPEIDEIATKTRGLIYKDIIQYMDRYIKTGKHAIVEIDQYNTCDPATGNWSERILSLKQYRTILKKNHFCVAFKSGFYNDNRNNFISSWIARIMNFLIRYSGKTGMMFAPLILLIIKKER